MQTTLDVTKRAQKILVQGKTMTEEMNYHKKDPEVTLTTMLNGEVRECDRGCGTTNGGTASGVEPGPITGCLHNGQDVGKVKHATYVEDE